MEIFLTRKILSLSVFLTLFFCIHWILDRLEQSLLLIVSIGILTTNIFHDCEHGDLLTCWEELFLVDTESLSKQSDCFALGVLRSRLEVQVKAQNQTIIQYQS
jgi:hypothetical protein